MAQADAGAPALREGDLRGCTLAAAPSAGGCGGGAVTECVRVVLVRENVADSAGIGFGVHELFSVRSADNSIGDALRGDASGGRGNPSAYRVRRGLVRVL